MSRDAAARIAGVTHFSNVTVRTDVAARRSVHFGDSGDSSCREMRGQPNQRGPASLVHEGNPALHSPTHEDLLGIPDGARHPEDEPALRVSPPAATNRAAHDCFRQTRYWPSCGFEDDAVRADESQSLARSHIFSFGANRVCPQWRGRRDVGGNPAIIGRGLSAPPTCRAAADGRRPVPRRRRS